jgi:Asp-tRNA(Asn)/Glu-tRNA(Gln) amidotransferase A subunit family amidase
LPFRAQVGKSNAGTADGTTHPNDVPDDHRSQRNSLRFVGRWGIARDWAGFLDQYPVLLMPNSWERQFPIDDDLRSQQRFEEILLAQTPMLNTTVLGLAGLSVPSGVVDGLPVGVQLVTTRFREDLALRAGEVIERSAAFSALDVLAPRQGLTQSPPSHL